jgi:hypothetical protein
MRTPAVAAIAAVFTLGAAAPPASAAVVRADSAVKRSCRALLPAGTPGVAHARFTPARSGLVTTRLAARRGDWDLAVFDGRTRVLHDASATFGARERAIAWGTERRTLVAQGCRRKGRARTARVAFDLAPASPASDAIGRAALVRVALPLPGDFERLEALGLDVTHNHGEHFADVVVYGSADRLKLARNAFAFTVRVPDMRATDLASLRTDALRAVSGRSALPSGREQYRTYAEYGEELKRLVETHGPRGVVRAVTIGRSLEGRPIDGVEIASGVAREDDGRPVFAVMGLHHAREWPSGEMPMELAHDLLKSHAGGDARVTALLDRVRVLVLPMINPDGFVVSRGAGALPVLDENSNLTLPLALADAAAYKRKNCRPPVGDPATRAIPCALRPPFGVDLNRNYGAYWGGIGSSDNPALQNNRGPSPYSEPESEAVHQLSQRTNIVTLITHHTFTAQGIWLRQPGFCSLWPTPGCQREEDVVPDEAGMKALGDAMGAATGWRSDLGWTIGEITGATEDWNYFSASAYGYTPEQRGPNFHPSYAQAVVREYVGAGAEGGVREALLLAAEQSADPTWHSVLKGEAAPGTVLRLVKRFQTPTSQPGVVVNDELNMTLKVGPSGTFEWHVNPSTRPLVAAPEAYTLRCEDASGQVTATREVVVGRGQTLDVGSPCPPPVVEPPPPTGPRYPSDELRRKRGRPPR